MKILKILIGLGARFSLRLAPSDFGFVDYLFCCWIIDGCRKGADWISVVSLAKVPRQTLRSFLVGGGGRISSNGETVLLSSLSFPRTFPVYMFHLALNNISVNYHTSFSLSSLSIIYNACICSSSPLLSSSLASIVQTISLQ